MLVSSGQKSKSKSLYSDHVPLVSSRWSSPWSFFSASNWRAHPTGRSDWGLQRAGERRAGQLWFRLPGTQATSRVHCLDCWKLSDFGLTWGALGGRAQEEPKHFFQNRTNRKHCLGCLDMFGIVWVLLCFLWPFVSAHPNQLECDWTDYGFTGCFQISSPGKTTQEKRHQTQQQKTPKTHKATTTTSISLSPSATYESFHLEVFGRHELWHLRSGDPQEEVERRAPWHRGALVVLVLS